METKVVREYVANLYPNKTWRSRVDDMPDNQVYAIYRSSLERKKKPKKLTLGNRGRKEKYHQITIWEYMASKEVAK